MPGPALRLSGHLLEAALLGPLVLPPAQDPRAVADAPSADMVERHFDHQLGTQLDPLELLLVLPPARIALPPLAGLRRPQTLDERTLPRPPPPGAMTPNLPPHVRGL